MTASLSLESIGTEVPDWVADWFAALQPLPLAEVASSPPPSGSSRLI